MTRVFFSYSHRDENLRKKLEICLAALKDAEGHHDLTGPSHSCLEFEHKLSLCRYGELDSSSSAALIFPCSVT